MKTIILIVLFSASVFGEVVLWETKFKHYVKGLPKDVVEYLKRADGCHHFGGEEAYDEQRKQEILAAVTKLKCNSIDKDKDALLRKYKKKKTVVTKINGFPDILN